MIPILITLQYMRGHIKETRQIKVSLDATVSETIRYLVETLDLPLHEGERQYTYELLRQREVLSSESRLLETGISEGDILQLVAFDAKATMMGRVVSGNILSRLGGKGSNEPLPVKAWLETLNGSTIFQLRHVRALIGRADADMGFPSEALDADLTDLDPKRTVSRPHALIVYNNGEFTIRDLYSQLGVLINGERMPANKAQSIRHNDRLMFGDVELRFRHQP